MDLDRTLSVLNGLVAEGIIGRYAIGGAVAAFLYIEPGSTYDLDIFISWEPIPGGLVILEPIYDYLKQRGYAEFRHEGIVVEGWPVQFLPTDNGLVKEALEQAQPITLGEVETQIFTQEHLMAICLKTGRPKDMARLLQFIEAASFDRSAFDSLISRWDLQEAWLIFKNKFSITT
jgi:hypothetical protein